VRVVDVEPASSAKEAKEVQTTAPLAQSQPPASCNLCACAKEAGLGVLEESMRALTLGKK